MLFLSLKQQHQNIEGNNEDKTAAFAGQSPSRFYSRLWRRWYKLGFVELCAKILQIMRNDFKGYARTF